MLAVLIVDADDLLLGVVELIDETVDLLLTVDKLLPKPVESEVADEYEL